MSRLFLVIGCLFGLFGLIAGTIHAHALEGIIARQIYNKKINEPMFEYIKKIHQDIRKRELEESKEKKKQNKDDGVFESLGRTVKAEMAAEAKARKIGQKRLMRAFETGALYQFFHALALVLAALFLSRSRSKAALIAGWLFLIGTLFFSGGLYIHALTGAPIGLAPIGGFLLMLGWIFLAFSSLKKSWKIMAN